MQLSVNTPKLHAALKTVLPVILSGTSLPILQHVLLKAKGNHVSLTGTNLNMTVTLDVDAEVKKDGACTVSANKLNHLVGALTPDTTELDLGKKGLTVRAGSSVYSFVSLTAEEFPSDPAFEDELAHIEMSQTDLVSLLHLTAFCASKDESRYVLNGVYLGASADSVRTVATDGRRLSLFGVDVETDVEKVQELIIPSDTVSVLSKLLPKPAKPGDKEDTSKVTIRWNDRAIVFDLGNAVLRSRLVEGNFPNYKQVIPPATGKPFTIGRADLLAALDRIAFCSEGTTLTLNRHGLTLDSRPDKADDSTGSESLLCDCPGKSGQQIAFNNSLFAQALKVLDCDEVNILVADEVTPIVLTSTARPQFKYILMPLRLAQAPPVEPAPQPSAEAAAPKTQDPKPKNQLKAQPKTAAA